MMFQYVAIDSINKQACGCSESVTSSSPGPLVTINYMRKHASSKKSLKSKNNPFASLNA